ncbi:transcription factor [Pochonia chlamydosporia 170]|uniref:Transcription factor n=1 Tax=Pochonia chlamydosporia 170 TaxID=1380566 RepID=A0A179F463_METCM|nr:transcription factor [Pochonia chlamydosporia 170]OAQ60195.1 transcription factor [Pochonia chlamydosporia 170]
MSDISAKIHRIATMAAELQQEIEVTKHGRLNRRQQQKTHPFPEQPELETILQAIEQISNSLKKIQMSIATAKSQSRCRKHRREARTFQQKAPPLRFAQLRPKMSVPQPGSTYHSDMELDSPTSSSLSDLSTDDLIQTRRNSLFASDSETTPHLRVEQMGDRMVDSLEGLIGTTSFAGKVTVEGPFHVDWAAMKFNNPQNGEQFAVKYRPTSMVPGCTSLSKSKSTGFQRLDLSAPIQSPSEEEALTFLEQAVRDPPKKTLQYYVGPRLIAAFGNLLHSGPVLSAISPIEGVNSVYDHIGEKWSGTAFHREDAHFRSCNLTLSGVKLWIIIRQHHTQKFETYIRSFATDTCDQFVRHQGLLFAPSELRNQNIDFEILCTKAGDLVITEPRQYHAVINFTNSYAISTNFLLRNEEPLPLELRHCPRCGLGNLYDQEGKIKYAERLIEIQKCTDEIIEQDPQCSIPIIDRCNPPSAKVFRLAAVIRSRAVILQFFKIVEATRKDSHPSSVSKPPGKPQDRVLQHITNLARSEKESDLLAVRRRYDQILLVRDIEESKMGQLRTDSAFLKNICEKVGWSAGTLRTNREHGKGLNTISEAFNGLIYFIPTDATTTPAKATVKEYVDMAGNRSEFEDFKKLMNDDHITKLCTAGKVFQQSHSGSTLPKFTWEAAKISHLSSLSMDELLSYIAPAEDAG